MFLIGYDIGSSSIKATLLEAETGKVLAAATSPKTEMEMIAVNPDGRNNRRNFGGSMSSYARRKFAPSSSLMHPT